jgi:hypothetical protein
METRVESTVGRGGVRHAHPRGAGGCACCDARANTAVTRRSPQATSFTYKYPNTWQ